MTSKIERDRSYISNNSNRDRSKILAKLERLWNRYPEQRLGQLLENYVFRNGQRGDRTSIALFHQRDEETLRMLKLAIRRC